MPAQPEPIPDASSFPGPETLTRLGGLQAPRRRADIHWLRPEASRIADPAERLRPARGLMLGLAAGVLLWGIVIGAVWLAIG